MARTPRIAFLSGVAAGIAATAVPARAAQYSYKFAHNLPVSHPLHVRAVEMWNRVRDESGGRFEMQIFPNNVLGGDLAVLTQLRSNAIQFFFVAGALLGQIVPVAGIENVGFAFRSSRDAHRAMDGKLGELIRRQIAERSGLVPMDKIWENGMRQITTSTKPVRDASDLAGLKLRTPPTPIFLELFKALGAAPTPIVGAELYTALQTHIVDGQENALLGIEVTRLFEVQKYLSLSNHSWAGYWMLANGEAWRSLPADIQASIIRNNARAAVQQRRDVEALNVSLADKLRRRGMIVNDVGERSFRSRLGEYYDRWKAEFGPRAWSVLESYAGRLA